MLNLWIFFYGAVLEEQELQQMEGFGKFCIYFLGFLGSAGSKRHEDPRGCGTRARSDLGKHSGVSGEVGTTGPVLPRHQGLGSLSGGCCRELATLRFGMMQKVARE